MVFRSKKKPSINIDGVLSNDSYANIGQRKNIGRFMYFGQHSTPGRAVYIDPKTRDLKVVFRGTKEKRDLKTDAALAFGFLNKTKRFKDELKAVQDLQGKYNNISLSGHSLGGALSREIGRKTKLESSGYNAGYGLDSLFKKNPKNYTETRTKYDPISALGLIRNKDIQTIDSTYIDPHSSKNFI